MHRTAWIAVLAIATQGISACASLPFRHTADGDVASAWGSTLPIARAYAVDGKFAQADSTLATFAARHPGTPSALETAYWRAVFKLDPTSSRTSVQEASSLLDAYLTDPRPREHFEEALVLRRLAGQVENLNRLAATAMSQAKDANSVAANARAQAADANARADAAKADAPASAESEIRRLKDELAKANAELDRIKKRLTKPPG